MAGEASRPLLTALGSKRDDSSDVLGFSWRRSKWFIVYTVAIALWTDLFLYSLVVPILPFLLRDRLDLPPSQIQSCVSGLLAAFAASSFGFSPIIGYLSDLISTRQAPFFLGLLALLGSTALFLLGQSLPVLFIARILQGLSAALVWTVGLVLCVEAVGTDNLGKTMGGVCIMCRLQRQRASMHLDSCADSIHRFLALLQSETCSRRRLAGSYTIKLVPRACSLLPLQSSWSTLFPGRSLLHLR